MNRFTIALGWAALLLMTTLHGACGGGGSGSITPEPSSDASLAALTLSQGTLSPAFVSDTTDYACALDGTVASVTVTATTTEPTATLSVNGIAAVSGTPSIPLGVPVGSSIVRVDVTAPDGASTRTYLVTLDRDGTTVDASLAGLTISGGTLSPALSPDVTGYACAVGALTTTVRVTATTTVPGATVTINGASVASGSPSAPIAVPAGPSVISIDVTALDGVTSRSYAIVTSRSALPSQVDYIKASNTGGGDQFGFWVDMDGDTLVVGAAYEDSAATGVNGDQSSNAAPDSGAAYVFVRQGATWTQQAYLKASNTGAGDGFGGEVAISGNTIVVGAVFEDSAATGVNGNEADNSVSDSGAVYVFTRTGTTWSQQAYLKASNTALNFVFGVSLDISGDTIVVGSQYETSAATGVNGNAFDRSLTSAGAAYVFVRNGTTWSQQAYLKASNTGLNDLFGTAVAVSGDTIVVGALYEASASAGVNGNQADNSANNAGAAYVFVRSGTTWSQQAYLKSSNPAINDVFGALVDIDGDTIVVGAPWEDSAATGVGGNQADNTSNEAGAAYVFVRSGTTWSQQAYLKASNTGLDDRFGSIVRIKGDVLLVGTGYEDSSATGINGNQADNSAASAGAGYLFTRTGTTWSQLAYIKPSNTETGDFFLPGAIAGDTIIGMASGEDSASTGMSGNPAGAGAADAGAVYIFR